MPCIGGSWIVLVALVIVLVALVIVLVLGGGENYSYIGGSVNGGSLPEIDGDRQSKA